MATYTQAGTIKVLWTTATVDLSSTTTGTTAVSAGITITGAALGDPVILGTETAVAAGLHYDAFVSAADEVKVQVANVSAGTVDSASQIFHIAVVKLQSYS